MPRFVDALYLSLSMNLTTATQYLATLASLYNAKKYSYPKSKIDDSWEKVLLNQCTCCLMLKCQTKSLSVISQSTMVSHDVNSGSI